MTDIVARLAVHAWRSDGWTRPDAAEAAAEIERLRAERDRLRDALRYWLHDDEVRDFGEWFEVGCKISRAALKETGHE
jgi:hypothetical protein